MAKPTRYTSNPRGKAQRVEALEGEVGRLKKRISEFELEAVAQPGTPGLEFVKHGGIVYVRATDGRYLGSFEFDEPAETQLSRGQVRGGKVLFRHFGSNLFDGVVGSLRLNRNVTIDGEDSEPKSCGPFDLGRSGAVEYDVDWAVTAPESFQRGVVRIEADLVSGGAKVGSQLIGNYEFEKEPLD